MTTLDPHEQIKTEARRETEALVLQMVQDPLLETVAQRVVDLRATNGDENAAGFISEPYDDLQGLGHLIRAAADFRTDENGNYRERWEIDEEANRLLAGMPGDLEADITTVVTRYDLVGSTSHTNPHKDAELILGGGGVAPLDRSRYAASQIQAGKLVTPKIIGLGSARSLTDKDRERAGDYAKGAETEEDLVRLGISKAFGLDPNAYTVDERKVETAHPDVPNVQRIGRIASSDFEIIIISAAVITDPYRSNGKPRNRANTTDTIQTIVNESIVQPGQSVGAVTNAHFRPFQRADVRNILGGHGIQAEVIGFDPSEFDRPEKQPHELLMELLTLVDRLGNKV